MEKSGATPPAFPHINHMALKSIGRADWLGVASGGTGYFVKYCPCCKEHVYLVGDELEEFLLAVQAPRLWRLVKHYFKLRVHIPKIHFKLEWNNPRELEIIQLNERIELGRNTSLAKFDPKKFSRTFFDQKYSLQGGIAQLENMIRSKATPTQIGERFGFSRQRAFDILQSYAVVGKVTV